MDALALLQVGSIQYTAWLICIFFLQLTKSINSPTNSRVCSTFPSHCGPPQFWENRFRWTTADGPVMMDLTQTLWLFSPRRFWKFFGRWRAHDVFQTTSILLAQNSWVGQVQQTLHETKNITCLFVSSDPRGTNCFKMVRMNIKRYMFSQCFTFQAT